MERIMKAQALRNNDMGFNMSKYTLEINPHNKVIQRIKSKIGNDDEIKSLRDLTYMLYDITLLSSGMTLEEPALFSNRMLRLINIGLGIDDDEEEVEELEDNDTALESNDKESGDVAEESIMEEVD